MNNIQKEIILEENVEYFLESLKDGSVKPGGSIVDYHHLLRRKDYPDFYARSCSGKEYLIECKNLAEKRLPDGTIWQHNLNWVKQNIIIKHWKYKRYETRNIIRYRHDHKPVRYSITIRKSPIPALITSHFNFDSFAKNKLLSFFGSNIIVFGGQLGSPGPWAGKLLYGLRDLSLK